MKLVRQDAVNVIEECEEYRLGPRKNFHIGRRGNCLAPLVPAWSYEDSHFQLTVHPQGDQDSPVVAFAIGRSCKIHNTDAAVVSLIGVHPSYAGRRIGLRMQEFLIKATGLPIAAAHTQTPQGAELWLRMLTLKRIALHVLWEHGTVRIHSRDDIKTLPCDIFDGDATFIADKVTPGGRRGKKVMLESTG